MIRKLLLALSLFTAVAAAEKPAAEYRATIDEDGVQRVTVVGGSYFFSPSRILVKINIPVELSVRKEGVAPHDIAMHSPEAGMEFSHSLGSKPLTISFIPTKVGSYPFFCTKKAPLMKAHRDKGMEGTIEVVE
jgi:plastocyanin domain-containing protein